MAKKAKKETKEIIPEGMSKKDYADKAFRKKVTIINACIVSAFLIGILVVIFVGWYNNKRIEDSYIEQRDSVIAQLKEIEEKGGSFEDKRVVKIEVNDDNYTYWFNDLEASYNASYDDEIYGQFGGAEIHLEGMFYTRELSHITYYWVYRNHQHVGDDGHDHDHDHEGEEEFNIGEMLPIEVIFADDVEIPENGTWVSVTGVVSVDTNNSASAIRDAKITILDEPGQEYVE
ncbi:MAG: hypothetical protein E7533_06165 [Ruminococcaceae bacterium]|nr:hypothetical protein [Oscillospiraceae bacterium]